ncbi:MAG: hypothetical protein ACRCWJ_18855 [Casimicrobium sp.]
MKQTKPSTHRNKPTDAKHNHASKVITVPCPVCGGEMEPASLYQVEFTKRERAELLRAGTKKSASKSKHLRDSSSLIDVDLDHVYITESAYHDLRADRLKVGSVCDWLLEGITNIAHRERSDQPPSAQPKSNVLVNTSRLWGALTNEIGFERVDFVVQRLDDALTGDGGGEHRGHAVALFACHVEALSCNWLTEVLKNPPSPIV